MKTILRCFLVLTCLGLNVNAQRVTVPNRPPNLNTYYNPNTEAAAYASARGIVDRHELRYLHNWFNGLDSLHIASNVMYGASFRVQHKSQSGTNLIPFTGPTTYIHGGLQQYTNGFFFPGTTNTTYYLEIPNTFWTTAKTNYSFVIAYRSAISTNTKLSNLALLSSWNAAIPPVIGPGVAVGSHQSGTSDSIKWPGTAVQYWSGSGLTNGAGFFPYGAQADQGKVAGIVTTNIVHTDSPQLLITSFSPTTVAMQGSVGPWVSSTVSGYGPTTNPATVFKVGTTAFSTNTVTQANCFEGDIAMIYIFNKALTESEANEIRKLYTRTIGCRYIPRINLLLDGDYLAYGNSYGGVHVLPTQQHLTTNSLWGKFTTTGCYATTNSSSTDIANRTLTSVAKFDVDIEYALRQYYLHSGGTVDLLSGVSAENLLVTNKVAYANSREAGNVVIAHTLPLTTNIHANAAIAAQWTNYNNILRTSRTSYDYLVDLAADATFLNYNDTTYYTNSGVNLTTSGYKKWADAIRTKIRYP